MIVLNISGIKLELGKATCAKWTNSCKKLVDLNKLIINTDKIKYTAFSMKNIRGWNCARKLMNL